MSNLSAMVDALRARGSSDEELADATRIRLRRSLETRARTRMRAVRALVIAGIVLGATGAWALSTGRAGALWSRIAGDDKPEAAEPAHQISMRLEESVRANRSSVAPTGPAQLAVPDAGWPEVPATTLPAPVPRPAPTRPAAKPLPIDPLYRAAHELHFRGRDHAATLAAWDAYLAAEPAGRFVLEARYNRALVLVRLDRYADARIALEPFARGEITPAGYRQREATAILDRIVKLEDAKARATPSTKSVNE
jgi:hypothetical protein